MYNRFASTVQSHGEEVITSVLQPEVDAKSGVPIYLQLVGEIRRSIEDGGLGAGERLPTVRALAQTLNIAPNTVVRSYTELQRMGLLESRPGVGTVVAEGAGNATREDRVEALHGRLAALVRDAAALGITEDELWERFDAEFERLQK